MAGSATGKKRRITAGKQETLTTGTHYLLQEPVSGAVMTIAFLSPPKLDGGSPELILEREDGLCEKRSFTRDWKKGPQFHELRFEKLKGGMKYTLKECWEPGQFRVIFAGLPYGEIVDQARPSYQAALQEARFAVPPPREERPPQRAARSAAQDTTPIPVLHRFQVRLREIDRLYELSLHKIQQIYTKGDPISMPEGRRTKGIQESWLSTARFDAQPPAPRTSHAEQEFQRWKYRERKEADQDPDLVSMAPLDVLTYGSQHFGKRNQLQEQDGATEEERIRVFDQLVSPRTTIKREGIPDASRTFCPQDSHQLKARQVTEQGSTIVTEKWAYIFRAEDETGRNGELLHELKFDENGQFQRTTGWPTPAQWQEYLKKAQGGSRPDEKPRPVAKTKAKEIWLDAQAFVKDSQTGAFKTFFPKYFFFIAPWQLTWQGVEDLRANLAARAVRLGDYFHTAIFNEDRPEEYVALLPVPESRKQQARDQGIYDQDPRELLRTLLRQGRLSFALHLVDPFSEAFLRAGDLSQILDDIEKNLPRDQNDPKYLLAKELEFFTARDPKLRQKIEKKLYDYLYPKGIDSVERHWQMAEIFLEKLVSWIGRYERRVGAEAYWETRFAFEKVWHGNVWEDRIKLEMQPPVSKAPLVAEVGQQNDKAGWRNHYSEAVSYYLHAPEEVRGEVVQLDCHVKWNLPALAAGQEFLFKDLRRVIAENQKIAKEDIIPAKQITSLRELTNADQKNHQAPPKSAVDLALEAGKTWTDRTEKAFNYLNTAYAAAWVYVLGGRDVVKTHLDLRKSGIGPLLTPEEEQWLQEPAKLKGNPWTGAKELRKRTALRGQVEKSALEAARDTKGARVPLFPSSPYTRAAASAAKTAAFLGSALEAYSAIRELSSSDDPVLHFRAVASMAATLKGALETGASWTVVVRGQAVSRLMEGAVSKTGSVAAGLAFMTNLVALSQAKERSQYIARSIKCTIALVGLFSLSGPVGMTAAVITFACGLVLDWYELEFSEVVEFLERCEFGEQAKPIPKLPLVGSPAQVSLASSQANQYSQQRRELERYMFQYDLFLGHELQGPALPAHTAGMRVAGFGGSFLTPKFEAVPAAGLRPSATPGWAPAQSVFYLLVKPRYPHCYGLVYGVEVSDLSLLVQPAANLLDPGWPPNGSGLLSSGKNAGYAAVPLSPGQPYQVGLSRKGALKEEACCIRVPIAILEADVANLPGVACRLRCRVEAKVKVQVQCLVSGETVEAEEQMRDLVVEMRLPVSKVKSPGPIEPLNFVLDCSVQV